MITAALLIAAWGAGPLPAQTLCRLEKAEQAGREEARAWQLWDKGDRAAAFKTMLGALRLWVKLYPPATHPIGHRNLADCFVYAGRMALLGGNPVAAEPYLARGLRMREALCRARPTRDNQLSVARGLSGLAMALRMQGKHDRAEPLLRRCLELLERIYPKKQFPRGHGDLVAATHTLAVVYIELNDLARAEPLLRRSLAAREALYPKKEFPRGHPSLATGLSVSGAFYRSRGDYAKAESLSRRALEMREALYAGKPHPDLVTSLANLGVIYREQGDYVRAEPLLRRAIEMRGKLPGGPSPELLICISSLGTLHMDIGEYASGRALLRRALELAEKASADSRLPKGNDDLANALDRLAALHAGRGEWARAAPLLRRALTIVYARAADLASYPGETTALNYLAAQERFRDAYLDATRDGRGADSYDAVWQTKAALARVAEARHLATLAATSPRARELSERARALGRRQEQLLLARADTPGAAARRKALEEVARQLAEARRELVPLAPGLKRSDELARAAPPALRKALPSGSALVDLVKYTRFRPRAAKAARYRAYYAAFVLTPEATARVDLEAGPVEEALGRWREAIKAGSDAEPRHAAEVHRLLWSPLRKHLPARASLVYVCPDAALSRLPWPALRDGKTGRVLLEEHAVAAVPHGPFLLDRLTRPRAAAAGKPTLLAVGGVAYDKKPAGPAPGRGPAAEAGMKWPALMGARKELDEVTARARGWRVVRLEGERASVQEALRRLPEARAAHLATHGFFADRKSRTAFQFDPALFGAGIWPTGETAFRFGAAARSPLVLSGLVCAGANLADTPGRGILTAEAVVGLDLHRLDLAVLSACETGLGEVAGGEGVYGLTRAFHIAGTRDVVASLWKVDDEATAALMSLFYRQLWDREKPVGPAEAMRRAQLALYRDPGRIKEWAAGRGPVPKPIAGSGTPVKPIKGKTSPTRAWAAFLVSGPGR